MDEGGTRAEIVKNRSLQNYQAWTRLVVGNLTQNIS